MIEHSTIDLIQNKYFFSIHFEREIILRDNFIHKNLLIESSFGNYSFSKVYEKEGKTFCNVEFDEGVIYLTL